MNTYLTIMVTVLVATQIVRVVQNTISLYRQRKQIEKNVNWILENDVSEHDFAVQREVFYRLATILREYQINKKEEAYSRLNEWLKEREDADTE